MKQIYTQPRVQEIEKIRLEKMKKIKSNDNNNHK